MSDHKPSGTSAREEAKHLETEHTFLPGLLLSLVFVLLIVPIAESVPFAAALLRLGITAVLVSAAIAIRRRRALLAISLFAVAVAVPVSWVTLFVDQPYLFLFSCVLDSLFFVAMAIMILVSVIRKHLATIHSIFGAISAYLLLGLAWAVLYWGLDHVDSKALYISRDTPATAQGSAEVKSLSQFVYFSFVTMSTLGYGDIAPRTPLTQTLTWMQSVTGQFYIAVLVAWLVSEIPRRQRDTIP